MITTKIGVEILESSGFNPGYNFHKKASEVHDRVQKKEVGRGSPTRPNTKSHGSDLDKKSHDAEIASSKASGSGPNHTKAEKAHRSVAAELEKIKDHDPKLVKYHKARGDYHEARRYGIGAIRYDKNNDLTKD